MFDQQLIKFHHFCGRFAGFWMQCVDIWLLWGLQSSPSQVRRSSLTSADITARKWGKDSHQHVYPQAPSKPQLLHNKLLRSCSVSPFFCALIHVGREWWRALGLWSRFMGCFLWQMNAWSQVILRLSAQRFTASLAAYPHGLHDLRKRGQGPCGTWSGTQTKSADPTMQSVCA